MEEYDDLLLDEEILFDLNPILSEIYSSPLMISSNTSSSSSEPQTSDDDGCVMKQLITSPIIWESSSASASAPAPAPHMFSFGNNSYFPAANSDILNSSSTSTTTPEVVVTNSTHDLSSQIIDFSSSSVAAANKHDSTTTTTRTPSQAHEHLMSERKHREHLRQLFISLSKILPGLKKLDKASLLEDAANYLKALEERVAILEEEQAKRSSIEASKLTHNCSYNTERRSIDDDDDDENNNMLEVPEIKARISERKVLIKISCKKEKGLMPLISCEMEKMHLTLLDMRMMPFGGSAAALDITLLAETQSEFRGTVKDIVDHLQRVVLKNPPLQQQQ
ncbi:hypothetical protein MIMGU_mgv1a021517mg [Erythranthe guttata]|uniref:BHLH domain-containing protein n=1 Tax=Erythranthe guttata TaxID=4155 RepID=A0A022Q285_ERYGU|nr:PREDICTED: transcription factor bHLH18-like [Erythranthe guttata]EYU22727.1 hypothetical protein MIMGU_mgv1a021517mg [Erythranthe guttata]|eukprot:XP_012854699.1 PREDICTED: transcription factor bHLH18-like [Erythranthe guttata]